MFEQAKQIYVVACAARVTRIAGWVLAALIVFVGQAIADSTESFRTLVLRVCVGLSLLAITQLTSWLLERHAERLMRHDRVRAA